MSVLQARAASVRRLRFGHCVLDEGLGSLTAPDGSASVLRPKTFELLRVLLSQAGRVVSREEILDTVWPGLFVTDDSVTQCVVEIRKAMGPGGAGLLKTVPRRGYLLQAEVIEDAPVGATPALLSSRAEDRPSIAVLPFRKDHPDQQEAWFADGIIEGIVHALSGLDGVFLISRGAALAFAQQTLDARSAGRELGVRYVLYGGVRRAAGRLRITTELTDAERGTILCVDRYDGIEEELFDLQDRIAEQVVSAVAPQLREHELARALRKPPTSLSAYDLVLLALDRLRRLDAGSLTEARELLRRAAAADPGYAPAHSYAAWVHVLRIAEGWSADAARDTAEAEQAATRAIEADRNDGLALAIQAYVVACTRRDHAGGQRLLDRALAATPNNALAWALGRAGLRPRGLRGAHAAAGQAAGGCRPTAPACRIAGLIRPPGRSQGGSDDGEHWQDRELGQHRPCQERRRRSCLRRPRGHDLRRQLLGLRLQADRRSRLPREPRRLLGSALVFRMARLACARRVHGHARLAQPPA